MSRIKYELTRVFIKRKDDLGLPMEESLTKLTLGGIEVDDKFDVKRITHPGIHEAIGYVYGEHTVDFSFTDLKDQPQLKELYDYCAKGPHHTFDLILYAKNIAIEVWEPIVHLIDCTLTNVKTSVKAKEEWKPTASGYALNAERINHQYDLNIFDVENVKENLKPDIGFYTGD